MSRNRMWIKTMRYSYTMEYDSAVKEKNETMKFAGKWTELEINRSE